MFHYGSILNESKLNFSNTFPPFKNTLKSLFPQLEETKNKSLGFTKEKDTDYNSVKNNVSDLNLFEENSLIDNNINLNSSIKDSVAIRCSCSVCCGEPIALLESNFANSSLSSVSSPSASLSRNMIDSLITGSKWSGKTITYSFYEDSVFNGSFYGPENGVREVSSKIKSNVREILDLVETFVDLEFREVAETNSSTYGQIRYMLSNNPSYAYAYLPGGSSRSGDVHLNPRHDNANNNNGFQNEPGKHGYVTLIHETFHALGLEHPFSNSDGDALNPSQDNYSTTVMTYDFKGNAPGTAMPLDMAALQHLYGAAVHNSGNDTYVFGSTTDVFKVNGQSSLTSPHRLKQTIWDSSGTDTLDFSKLNTDSGGYLFDLNEGGWLVANAQNRVSGGEQYYNYGTSIAYDVTIEKVINSRSNDTIIGNEAANTFGGYAPGTKVGNDILKNTNQLDTLNLSSYGTSQVNQSKVNDDLVINLGNDGSVTIKNYYSASEANRLNISLRNDVPVVTEEPTVDPVVQPTEDPVVTENPLAIAEIGKITNIDHFERTIQLKNDYINPVVFAQPLSYNGSDPAIIRITDINANRDTVSFKVQEAEYRDVVHAQESFTYMVVEAGTWQLRDGTVIEASQVNTNKLTNSGWEQVRFSNSFNNTPVVLTQVQTENEAQFVRTRQKDSTRNGFSVSMEEEETYKYNGTHAEETIGWLAMSSGKGEWDGLSYEANSTANTVTHNWHRLNFNDFDNTPNLLASIATHDGRDASGIRYRDISGSNGRGIEIKIEEDQSRDSETRHTTEQVDFFAIEGTGILTAQAYDPLSAEVFEDSSIEILSEADFI